MRLGTITKQPFEVLDRYVDFGEEIAEGITLTIESVLAVDLADNTDSTAKVIGSNPAPTVSASNVIFWVKGGAHGERHKITLKVVASDGQKLEGDLDLYVIER